MAHYPKLPEEYEEDELGGGRHASLPSKEQRVLRGHEGAVLAVRFNPHGSYCLSCGKVRVWRADSRRPSTAAVTRDDLADERTLSTESSCTTLRHLPDRATPELPRNVPPPARASPTCPSPP